MARHVVKQGECISSIAARYGFVDWHVVYDGPRNAALRRARPNPNLLFPGDEVFVPDRRPKTVSAQTGQTVKVRVKLPRRELVLTLRDPAGQPMKDEPYTVRGGDEMRFGTTDGEGVLREELPANVEDVVVFAAGRSIEMRLGGLNPIDGAPDDGISGIQARLGNLGYYAGRVDGVLGRHTRQAIEAFAREHGLTLASEPSRELVDKLVEVHGS